MILVNNPGSWAHVYPPLRHAEWHGWTFTDTVFPFFLWIVGVALTLSTARRMERGEDRTQLLLHALRRAAILFAIGFLLGPFPNYDFSKIRIPGVLQRIAICYLAATAIFLFTKARGQIVALLAVYGVYWYFMLHYPVPGYGPGQLQPVGNFGQYLDNQLIAGHMWSQTKVWDPEGLFTTLPAIGTVLLGIFAGYLFRKEMSAMRRVALFLGGGVGLAVLGQALDTVMPINKPIWTVSYSLFMGGLASLCLGLWYWAADAARLRLKWLAPVEWMGRNAILLYMLSGLLADFFSYFRIGGSDLRNVLFQNVFGAFLSPLNASLAFGLLNVILLGLVAWGLNARRWYLKF